MERRVRSSNPIAQRTSSANLEPPLGLGKVGDVSFVCPVCGYPGLKEPIRSAGGSGSYEICPSCSFQFGVTDDDRGIGYEQWRTRWIRQGMPWDSGTSMPPTGWDPRAQLEALPLNGLKGPKD